MLKKLENNEIANHIDYAYSLALDLKRSAFPTYCDGIKTKEDFTRIAMDVAEDKYPNSEILLFVQERIKGWIHYYIEDGGEYLGFEAFCIEENTEDAIDEFLDYARKRYPCAEIYFGFPKENEAAVRHLKSRGFTVGDESSLLVFDFAEYIEQEEQGGVEVVSAENWTDFAALHTDEMMYWNAKRLADAYFSTDRGGWRLFLYRREGKAVANIYYKRYSGDGMTEIFGIDHRDEGFDADAERALLIRALNESKASGAANMVYFAEAAREHAVLDELGAHFITDYILLWNK